MPTVHIIVKGKVQGVFFRATAKKLADRLSLTGWIRNTEDGEVEVVVTGTEEQLQQFIQWCGHGPERAQVEEVIKQDIGDIKFNEFLVKRGH